MAASLLKKMSQNLLDVARWPQVGRLVLPCFISDSSVNDNRPSDANADISHSGSELASTATPTEGALRKFDNLVEKVKSQQPSNDVEMQVKRNESFATMLRKSNLTALGEDQNKRITGKIIEVMDNDLYIDFGGKFHCVCPRPRRNGELYQRASEVVVSLRSQEMSSAFLGSDIHITLLEADAILLGLRSTPS